MAVHNYYTMMATAANLERLDDKKKAKIDIKRKAPPPPQGKW
jgi:hypothetical protein